MNETGERGMRREIGVVLGALISVNATIGTGIFKKPADIVRHAGTLPAAMLVWIAGGAIAHAGALSLAELAAAIPRSGGLYEYVRRAWGPTPAFVFAWTKLTLLIPSAVGSFAKLAAEALASLLGLAPDPTRDAAVAVAFILGCAASNLGRVRGSAMVQAAFTVAKYGGVLLVAAVGCLVSTHGATVSIPDSPPPFETSATVMGFFTALVSVMWAYDGWADLSNMAGETKDPNRTLPRALGAGALAIVLVYLVANVGYARALGLDGLRSSTTGSNMAAANVATLTLGAAGKKLFSALILVSCLGGCASSLLTGSRVFVPIASDGLFPAWIGAISPGRAVPSRAVIVSAALGAMYVTFRSFEQLTDGFVVGYFPFYMLTVGAVLVLRRREPDLVRPFRVPLYPFLPLVFLAGALAVLVGAVRDLDSAAPFAFGVVMIGVVLGLVRARRARAIAGTGTNPTRL